MEKRRSDRLRRRVQARNPRERDRSHPVVTAAVRPRTSSGIRWNRRRTGSVVWSLPPAALPELGACLKKPAAWATLRVGIRTGCNSAFPEPRNRSAFSAALHFQTGPKTGSCAPSQGGASRRAGLMHPGGCKAGQHRPRMGHFFPSWDKNFTRSQNSARVSGSAMPSGMREPSCRRSAICEGRKWTVLPERWSSKVSSSAVSPRR